MIQFYLILIINSPFVESSTSNRQLYHLCTSAHNLWIIFDIRTQLGHRKTRACAWTKNRGHILLSMKKNDIKSRKEHLNQRIMANNGEYFLCQFLYHLRSWIIVFVHTMPKTWHLALPGEMGGISFAKQVNEYHNSRKVCHYHLLVKLSRNITKVTCFSHPQWTPGCFQ